MWSKIVSYSLLLSLFVLLTPRDIWHQCDHHKENSHQIGATIDHDHCFVCDFHLGVISQPVFLFYNLEKVEHTAVNELIQYSVAARLVDGFSQRGPPSISIA